MRTKSSFCAVVGPRGWLLIAAVVLVGASIWLAGCENEITSPAATTDQASQQTCGKATPTAVGPVDGSGVVVDGGGIVIGGGGGIHVVPVNNVERACRAFYLAHYDGYHAIQVYVEDYLAEHGRFEDDFVFPQEFIDFLADIQDDFDAALAAGQGSVSVPIVRDGITDYRVIWPYLWNFIPGTLFQLFTNHGDSQLVAHAWNIAWPVAISALLSVFGPEGLAIGVAISVALGCVQEFLPQLNPWSYYDDGNGVVTNYWFFAIPIPLPLPLGPSFVWVESQ